MVAPDFDDISSAQVALRGALAVDRPAVVPAEAPVAELLIPMPEPPQATIAAVIATSDAAMAILATVRGLEPEDLICTSIDCLPPTITSIACIGARFRVRGLRQNCPQMASNAKMHASTYLPHQYSGLSARLCVALRMPRFHGSKRRSGTASAARRDTCHVRRRSYW